MYSTDVVETGEVATNNEKVSHATSSQHIQNRRRWWYAAFLRFGPPLFVEVGWWSWTLLDPSVRLSRFAASTPFVGYYYYMSLTMVLGSLVAGMTSEGGGAVAFPAMTLALGVPPPIARDFSLVIQSFGMTCAAITIFGMGGDTEPGALVWSSFGGVCGLLLGLAFVAPDLPPAYAKMMFVCLWVSFAVALGHLNRANPQRRVYASTYASDEALLGFHGMAPSDAQIGLRARARRRRRVLLFGTGVFGGLTTSVAGSGLDMATFSILTLFFRVSEKVATQTSVCLMAGNAIVGVIVRTLGVGGTYNYDIVWNFVSVCVPIVVIGAPVGAAISAKYLNRHMLAGLIYLLDTIQFLAALFIVRPWAQPSPHNLWLSITSVVTLVGGSAFFYKVAAWGNGRDPC